MNLVLCFKGPELYPNEILCHSSLGTPTLSHHHILLQFTLPSAWGDSHADLLILV
jgi:hypothetical protein